MKIALFYPNNLLAGWYAQGGYRKALQQMGHEVVDAALPGNQPHEIEQVKKLVPTIEELKTCDVVLSAYHEYVTPWLNALYDFEGWSTILAEKPVICRFDESFDRQDLQLAPRWPEFKRWGNLYSFPAQQDADNYHGDWVPFGADTTIFNHIGPDVTITKYGTPERKYDIGFIGSMYPIRMEYLKRLAEHLPNSLVFNAAPVLVQDLGGVRGYESAMLLAENYRALKIFFCLPPMSRLIVAKVADIIACGTFVMYPKLPHHARINMNLFKDKEHLVYYDPGYLGQNAKQIIHYLENDDEREKIAATGCRHVHERMTLKHMLELILKQAESFSTSNVVEIKTKAAG